MLACFYALFLDFALFNLKMTGRKTVRIDGWTHVRVDLETPIGSE